MGGRVRNGRFTAEADKDDDEEGIDAMLLLLLTTFEWKIAAWEVEVEEDDDDDDDDDDDEDIDAIDAVDGEATRRTTSLKKSTEPSILMMIKVPCSSKQTRRGSVGTVIEVSNRFIRESKIFTSGSGRI
jgi:hypothetical protein